MATKKADSTDKPRKTTSLLQDVENIDLEMKPSDARKYMEGAFCVLLDMAQNGQDTHAKLSAVRGIDVLYTTLVMKDSLDENINKITRAADRNTDAVRKLRRKDNWGEGEENGED